MSDGRIKNVTYNYAQDFTLVSVDAIGVGPQNLFSAVLIDRKHAAKIVTWTYEAGTDTTRVEFKVNPILSVCEVMIKFDNGAGLDAIIFRAALHVPMGYYEPSASLSDRNENVDVLWSLLGDFWRLFEDRPVVSNLWGAFEQITDNAYHQVIQTGLSKSLKSLPTVWTCLWEKIGPIENATLLESSSPFLNPTRPEFNYMIDLPEEVVSIPTLFKNAYKIEHADNFQLLDGRDFIVHKSKLLLSNISGITGHYWAPTILRNREVTFRNFGYPVDVWGDESVEYYNRVHAIWYALWNGPTIAVVRSGLNILLGHPFLQEPNRVQTIEQDPTSGAYTVTMIDGQKFQSLYPPAVVEGQRLPRFSPIFQTVAVSDRVNDPDWWRRTPGKRYYFDTGANFDSGTAFDRSLSEGGDFGSIANYHTFKVKVDYADSRDVSDDLKYIRYFLNTIKPSGTTYVLEAAVALSDIYEDENHVRLPHDVEMAVEISKNFRETILEDYNLDSCIKQWENSDGRTYTISL